MPNYRQKNRNRNKNKNRNKQQANPNQQQNEKQQTQQKETQQQQEKQVGPAENVATAEAVAKFVATENEASVGNEPAAPTNSSSHSTHSVESKILHQAADEHTIVGNGVSSLKTTQVEMGAKGSKTVSGNAAMQQPQDEYYKEMQPLAVSSPKSESQQETEPKVIVHNVVHENSAKTEPVVQRPPTPSTTRGESQNANVKVIFHRIELEQPNAATEDTTPSARASTPPTEAYQIESPTNELSKAVSVSSVLIQEVSDVSLSDCNDNTPVVSEVDSETENVASPVAGDVEVHLMTAALQDDLKQRRVQKRVALESHFLPQLLSPRYLDCIIEENSDLSDARSDSGGNLATPQSPEAGGSGLTIDMRARRADARFPKSSLDFSRKHKHGQLPKAPTMPGAICEEPVAIVVETKVIEKGTTIAQQTANCTLLTSESSVVPTSEAAELVFINSASSSLSDLLELTGSSDGDADLEDDDDADADGDTTLSAVDLDTDASDIISYTPRNSSAASNFTLTNSSREQTPVNQSSEPAFPVATTHNNNDDTEAATLLKLNDSGGSASTIACAEMSTNIERAPPVSRSPVMLAISAERKSPFAETIDKTTSAVIAAKPKTTTIANEKTTNRQRSADDEQNGTIADSFSLTTAENVDANSLLETLEAEMNNVRDVLGTLNELTSTAQQKTQLPPPPPVKSAATANRWCYEKRERENPNRHASSQSPPPLPPPPQLDTAPPRNIHNTSLTQQQQRTHAKPSTLSQFAAVPATAAALVRQESADSYCSDSTVHSQCTAINLCASPQDDLLTSPSYISDHATPTPTDEQPIKKLRHLCTETLASMPYGEDVLEELAQVAQNINEVQQKQRQEQRQQQLNNNNNNNDEDSKMPYPLPNMPQIEQLELAAHRTEDKEPKTHANAVSTAAANAEAAWLAMPTEMDPKLLVCLSPAQRSYIEDQQRQQHATQKLDDLLDAHQKYIDRRGYHEYTKEQVRAMNDEKLQEQRILETAAFMKKLRKSLTPPPVPPPPVPTKSSETAAKAQNQKKIIATMPEVTTASKNDASVRNANEQFEAVTTKTMTTSTAITAPTAATSDKYAFGEHSAIGTNNVDSYNENNNKNRLLAIIHDDTSNAESQASEAKSAQPLTPSVPSSSSHENNSRQTMKQSNSNSSTIITSTTEHQRTSLLKSHQQQQQQQQQQREVPSGSSETQTTTQKQTQSLPESKMQSVDSDLAHMFPLMGKHHNIFDNSQKRYSNIESQSNTAPFCSQLLSTRPKRYSNIETHSYETRKRMENGQVVYDFTDSKHESQNDGVSNVAAQHSSHFPVKADGKHAFPATADAAHDQQRAQQQQQMPSSTSHVDEIMSALKLNTKNISTDAATAVAPPPLPPTAPTHFPVTTSTASNSLFTSVTKQYETKSSGDDNESRQQAYCKNSEKSTTATKTGTNESARMPAAGTYEEFRQRAKAAAEAIFPAHKQQQHDLGQPSTFHSVDHEKLFKDFDELSAQLRAELETSKAQRSQHDKSASLYDLSRMQMQFNDHFKDLKKHRHEHMQELEREIERSMRSRQQRQEQQRQAETEMQQQQIGRTYDIPIRIENGDIPPHVYEVPIQLEQQQPYRVTSPAGFYEDPQRNYRRAESMFNLTTEQRPQQQQQQQPYHPQQKQRHVQLPPHRERSYSNQYDGRETADDWSRYASDLGSSENITRPFAREVEICYQRQRAPRTIRAPRLTVSTNDLSSNNAQLSPYDSFNAYNVRRTHAPMMTEATPQKTQQQYLSCYSVLERDPNPTYICTTSRRGVSPAPTSPQPPQTEPLHFNVSEREMRQRRASLPREIQEQQLKYIQSKEDELKTEFERLQNERRRLMEEMQRDAATMMQQPLSPPTPTSPPLIATPPPRHAYRPVPPRRLPTLSEDEVFRQQMAEEWLSKVAEREERRMQKIIKISKSHDEEHTRHIPIELPQSPAGVQPDMGTEFMKRVKERRSKLAMPADSDWESGAESQPQPAGHTSETEDLSKIKVYEGKSEADLRHLPKHLREFAKFSNHQTEQIDGGQRELHQEEERRQEATDNTMSSALKKTSVMKTVRMSRQHPYATQQSLQEGNRSTAGDHASLSTQTPTQIPATTPTTSPPIQSQSTTTTTTTATPMSSTANFSPFLLDKLPTLSTPSSLPSTPFATLPQLSGFGDHFSNSPFKRKIFEEFDEFWRRFNGSASTTSNAFHQNI